MLYFFFINFLRIEINKETLDWCFSVVLSRSFSGSPERCKDEGGMKVEVDNSADFVLCPAIDLINHHQDFNCAYRWNQQKTAFEIFAKTKITKGQELFVNYGTSKTDFDLYNFYGFIPFSDDFQVELELARIKVRMARHRLKTVLRAEDSKRPPAPGIEPGPPE